MEGDGSPPASLTRKNGMGRPSRHAYTPPTSQPVHRPAGVGDVIGGKYRLSDTLGSGGMGRVYAAYHLMLDTKVALKFMHPHLLRDPVAVARFAREARAAATLKSAYAARIMDVDQLPSGELFIVMEYLEGHSLETVAASRRGLPIAEAVGHILQACDALAEAHAQGIVHRDVKPANLFLTRAGSSLSMIKVLDFGLAKTMAPQAFTSGSAGALGTPQYMSPEQIRGDREVDARTDVWSIGATLYELLAGRAAFEGRSAAAIFDGIMAGAFTPLRTHRPDVSPALAAVVDRCLAREPAARFASVRDLAGALAATIAVPRGDATPSIASALVPTASVPAPYVATLPSAGPGTAPSERPVVWTQAPSFHDERIEGPTLRQTILAALSGPALVAAVAAGVACFLGTAHLPALSTGQAAPAAAIAILATPELLTATSAARPARAKAASDATPASPALRLRSRQAAARR